MNSKSNMPMPAGSRSQRCGPLVGHTLDGRVVFANDAFCAMNGVSQEELAAQEPWFWSGIRDPVRRAQIIATVLETGFYTFKTGETSVDEGGSWRVESRLARLAGEPIIVSALFDISDERLAIQALDFSSMLLDQVNDAILCHTLDGRIIYVNDAACRERGYTREQFLKLTVGDLIAPDTELHYGDVADALTREGSITFESEDVRADGTRFTVEVRARLVDLDGEAVVVSVARDITDRKRAHQAVKRIAFSDQLTGLPNRRALLEHLEAVLADAAERDEGVMVAFADLDNLKMINDRYGHAVGDAALEITGMRLAAAVRAEDIVARLGGDEFVVVVRGIDGCEDAERVADKLLAAFNEPFEIDGLSVPSTASIGVALNQPRDIDVMEILVNADLAMYSVKGGDRNSYAMYDEMMRPAAHGEDAALRDDPQTTAPAPR